MKVASYISWQLIGECIYIFNEHNKTVIKLEDISTIIWKNLIYNKTPDEIAQIITKEYEVEQEEVIGDINEFIRDSIKNGILVGEK